MTDRDLVVEAIYRGRYVQCKKALERISSLDENAMFHLCRNQRFLPLVKWVVKHGKTDQSLSQILYDAVCHNNLKLAGWLLKNGADVNYKGGCLLETALTLAVYSDNINVVRLLLEKGADVNEENGDGKTALDIAREKGYDEIVRLLEGKQGGC